MAIRVDIRVDMELEVQLQTTRREGKGRQDLVRPGSPPSRGLMGDYAQPLLELDSRDRFLCYSVLVGMVEHGDCASLSLYPSMAVMFEHFL